MRFIMNDQSAMIRVLSRLIPVAFLIAGAFAVGAGVDGSRVVFFGGIALLLGGFSAFSFFWVYSDETDGQTEE